MDQKLLFDLLAPAMRALRGRLEPLDVATLDHAAEVMAVVVGFLKARDGLVVARTPAEQRAVAHDAATLIEVVLLRDAGTPMPPVEVW